MLSKFLKSLKSKIRHHDDGATFDLFRKRLKSGSYELEQRLRMGPNEVHAFITHADGTRTDLGSSKNLLTNVGRDWLAQALGGFSPAGNTVAADISTAVGATSITGTGSVWTASNLATPQLGCVGQRVYAAPHTTTLPVVYGNVISNTTNVLTIDKWYTAADATGTTPTSGDAFIVGAGGPASARFLALTTDSGAASAVDTVLASEITTNGCGRALGSYSHTYGQATMVLAKTFSASGTLTAIHKAGCFTALSSAGADPIIWETTLSADATVVSGDSLTLTWTFTISG